MTDKRAGLVENISAKFREMATMERLRSGPFTWDELASAALDIALEEAAKVADTLEDALSVEWRKGLKCDSHLEGRSDGAGEVAAAIRARKKP